MWIQANLTARIAAMGKIVGKIESGLAPFFLLLEDAQELGFRSLITDQFDRVIGTAALRVFIKPVAALCVHHFTVIRREQADGCRTADSTGNYGVYYAARHMDTAIAETAYHQTRFLRRTAETPCTVTMRAYLANVYADLHDIRERYTKSHHKTDYSAAQRLGARLRNTGSHGIVYRSARHRGGFCVALFRTSAIERRSGTVYTIQGPHFEYRFDGEAVNAYRKVTRKRWAPIPAELSIR